MALVSIELLQKQRSWSFRKKWCRMNSFIATAMHLHLPHKQLQIMVQSSFLPQRSDWPAVVCFLSVWATSKQFCFVFWPHWTVCKQEIHHRIHWRSASTRGSEHSWNNQQTPWPSGWEGDAGDRTYWIPVFFTTSASSRTIRWNVEWRPVNVQWVLTSSGWSPIEMSSYSSIYKQQMHIQCKLHEKVQNGSHKTSKSCKVYGLILFQVWKKLITFNIVAI
jgi:hypothetical protein